jgi:two-component system NtrC family response regulator
VRVVWDPVGAGYRYVDTGSANGTQVNGQSTQSGLLLPHDVIRAGDTLLVCVERDLGAELRARAQAMARFALPVLVRGETGSGKELLARSLHDASERAGPFVAVNCAALSSDLAAAEFFGHSRGAFSGAGSAREGLFRAADGGTLLLDEIGDLPLDVQGHLLRALQEGRIRPVGSDREVAFDVRIVSATHVDLEEAVRRGRFRADLLSRLTQLVLCVPPLRARRTEILPLARQFAPELEWGPSSAEALLIWDWPGNVRELRALVRAHAALEGGGPVRARDLAARLPSAARVLKRDPRPERAAGEQTAVERRQQLAGLLQKYEGNVASVARELGKPRAQIYRWMRALGVSRGRKR